MGRVAKLKLQYFGHITRGSAGQLALTVLYRRNHGRVTASRQTNKTVDTCTTLNSGLAANQLKMSQDRAQWRRKISEWSSAVANPHRGRRSISE